MNKFRNLKLSFITGLLVMVLISCGSEPASVDELKAAGKKAFLNKEYPKARNYLLKALAIEPSNKEALYFTAMSYKRDFIIDSAVFYFKRSDILYPKDRETNTELFDLSVQIENWDYAIGALGGLIATGDKIEDHYETFAELWAKKDHPANAYFFIKKALDVHPDLKNSYIQAANLASIVEPGPTAVKWIDSAITRFGEDNVLLGMKAMVLSRDEKYLEAEKIYRSLYDADTSVVPAKINLGNVLASQSSKSKKREALELYISANQTNDQRIKSSFKLDSLINDLKSQLK